VVLARPAQRFALKGNQTAGTEAFIAVGTDRVPGDLFVVEAETRIARTNARLAAPAAALAGSGSNFTGSSFSGGGTVGCSGNTSSTDTGTVGGGGGSAAVLSHGTTRPWPQSQKIVAPTELSGRPCTLPHCLHPNQIIARRSTQCVVTDHYRSILKLSTALRICGSRRL
jgi:hypothetical protein